MPSFKDLACKISEKKEEEEEDIFVTAGQPLLRTNLATLACLVRQSKNESDACRYDSIPVYRYDSIPMYRYDSIPLYRYDSISAYRYDSIPAYRYDIYRRV